MSNSTSKQAELNLCEHEFTLLEQQPTYRVRHLLEHLANRKITAQELLRQGKVGTLKISSPHGAIVIKPSRCKRVTRSWLWDICFVPHSSVS